MKKAYAVAAIACMGMASAATAQTFSPDGPRTITSLGDVTVSKFFTLSCGLSGTGAVSGGAGQIDSLAFSAGDPQCPNVTFSGFPYALTANSPTSITINNVVVTAISGNCAGSFTGTYDPTTGVASFNNAELPRTSGIGNCRLTGDLLIDPPAAVNP